MLQGFFILFVDRMVKNVYIIRMLLSQQFIMNQFIHSHVVIHGKDLAAFRQDGILLFSGQGDCLKLQERLDNTGLITE